VMHILTADGIPITSKQEYVNAVYWLDPMGTEGIKAVGSADAPLPLQIRGRGNYTWNSFQKKPYRLKLDEFQPLLGMNRSRHFALLAHADDKLAFLRNTVGFELSRRMGMPYTPAQQPLEVVLNGEYIGLYFLAETIRPEKHRLNITEQKNGEQNPDRITGGWLVEINNNREDNQLDFSVDGTDLQWFWVTYHSPDSLSPLQRDYLFGQFQAMLQAVYDPDKTSTDWEQLIDVHSLAQFYVIQEVLDHTEAFLGSCYLWKDLGEQRWKFGPVWDFGHAFNSSHSKSRFIYEQTPFPVSIIREIARFPRFQQEVRRVWSAFYPDSLNGIEQYMTDFLGTIAEAAKANAQHWPDYGNADVYASAAPAFDRLRQKVRWLNEQWKLPYPDDGQPQENSIRSVEADPPSAAYYTLSGQLLASPPARGLYIEAPRGSAAGRGKKFLKKNHSFLW